MTGPTAAQQTVTIGLDSRHYYYTAPTWGLYRSNFSEFRQTVSGLGFTDQVMNNFTASDLSGLTALVLYQPYTGRDPGFSSQEIADIQAFVQGGGGLLVISDQGLNASVGGFNQILAPYGISYSTATGYNPNGYTIGQFWYHPVTKGVQTVKVDAQFDMDVSSPGLDMTPVNDTQTGGTDFLAVWEGDGGAGKIVCINDSSLWADSGGDTSIYEADNRLLLQNILRFLVVKDPYNCAGPMPALFFRSTFESSTECWTEVPVGQYSAPVFTRADGGLGLSPNGSAASFGFWNSPVISVTPGYIYVVSWTVRSDTTPELCPQFRLRINDVWGRDSLFKAVESREGGENSPGPQDLEYWLIYFPGPGVTEITLSFDLLSFDGADELLSTIQLRELRIFPVNLIAN